MISSNAMGYEIVSLGPALTTLAIAPQNPRVKVSRPISVSKMTSNSKIAKVAEKHLRFDTANQLYSWFKNSKSTNNLIWPRIILVYSHITNLDYQVASSK